MTNMDQILKELLEIKKNKKTINVKGKENGYYKRIKFKKIIPGVELPVIEYSEKKKDWKTVKSEQFILPQDIDLLF